MERGGYENAQTLVTHCESTITLARPASLVET